MIRIVSRNCRWGFTALFVCLAAGACRAAPPPVTLRVGPLRDAGGEIAPELPARLTTALTRFLRDHAGPTVRIEATDRSGLSGEREMGARYMLEGDLSYAAGDNEESGRYLLVVRLTRQGRPTSLIGQWAGQAASLRYLTANLRNDPRVHTLGLIGEIGSRILAAVAAEAATPSSKWRTLWPRLTLLRSPKPLLIQAESPYLAHAELTGGDTFRFRFQTAPAGRVSLLTSVGNGATTALPLTLTANKTALPRAASADSQTIHLPDGIKEAWLLCRNADPNVRAEAIAPYRRLRRSCTIGADEDDAPVHVLNGVGPAIATQDTTLTPLLEEITKDPQLWRVLRLRIAATRK